MTTILMIEDQPLIRELVELYLTNEGFRVVPARNGHEGMFIAHQEQPDLILPDVMMPEIDGDAFLKRIKLKRLSLSSLVTVSGA